MQTTMKKLESNKFKQRALSREISDFSITNLIFLHFFELWITENLVCDRRSSGREREEEKVRYKSLNVRIFRICIYKASGILLFPTEESIVQ